MSEKKKMTIRSEEEKKYLSNRLSTIEGQVKGIVGMVDNDRYCGDILIQMSAIISSLRTLGEKMLDDHLTNCLADELKKNNKDAIKEVVELFQKLK